MITGDDEITIERKYQSPQTIHSNMRFLFGSNYPVTLPKESDEDSFWERMIIIPFLYSIPREQADHEILNKLLAEKDAIISYCLKAFHKVIKNNFIFSKCSAADEMKAQWRNTEQDLTYTLEEFFSERVNITGRPEDDVYTQSLYYEYQNYCKEKKYDYISYNKMIELIELNLSSKCKRKRIHHTGSNPKSGFTGLTLTPREK